MTAYLGAQYTFSLSWCTLEARAANYWNELCYETTKYNLEANYVQYKKRVDFKRRHIEFEVGDLVWAILTKVCFPTQEYNKLASRKIGCGNHGEDKIQCLSVSSPSFNVYVRHLQY